MNSSTTPVRTTVSLPSASRIQNKPPMVRVAAAVDPLVKAPAVDPITVEKLPTDRMLNTSQVSVLLGVSIETLKKWRQRGQGPRFVRYHDGAVRYRMSGVLRFLDDSTVAE